MVPRCSSREDSRGILKASWPFADSVLTIRRVTRPVIKAPRLRASGLARSCHGWASQPAAGRRQAAADRAAAPARVAELAVADRIYLAILALFYACGRRPLGTVDQPRRTSSSCRRVLAPGPEPAADRGRSAGPAPARWREQHQASRSVIPRRPGIRSLDNLTRSVPDVSTAASGEGFGLELLIYLLVFGLPILLFIWLSPPDLPRRRGRAAGRARRGPDPGRGFDEERPSTTFADIARLRGRQVRDRRGGRLLRRCPGHAGPARWYRAASCIGRPPGTGKTLLARAVTGEAQVPFTRSPAQLVEVTSGRRGAGS